MGIFLLFHTIDHWLKFLWSSALEIFGSHVPSVGRNYFDEQGTGSGRSYEWRACQCVSLTMRHLLHSGRLHFAV